MCFFFLLVKTPGLFRYGRWKILVPTGVLQLVFAVGCAFIQNYYIYIFMRFLIAINTSGAYMTGFVLSMNLDASAISDLNELMISISFSAMEMSPDKYRTYIGFSFQAMFAVGITVVAGWAYLIRDWSYLQLCLGLHSVVMLCHWW